MGYLQVKLNLWETIRRQMALWENIKGEMTKGELNGGNARGDDKSGGGGMSREDCPRGKWPGRVTREGG